MLPAHCTALLKAATDIKEGTFWEQLRSSAFLRVTILMVVASFWANFYIGTIDIQVMVKACMAAHA